MRSLIVIIIHGHKVVQFLSGLKSPNWTPGLYTAGRSQLYIGFEPRICLHGSVS